MTATQDQALPSRQKRKHIKKQIETSMSRLCGKKEEIKFHILSECSKIAATDYKKRHDGVANTVHWNQIKQYEFKTTQKWATRQNSVEKPKRKNILGFEHTNRPCDTSQKSGYSSERKKNQTTRG